VTEGQALLEHSDGCFQVLLGEVQAAKARMYGERCAGPLPILLGKAQRLFPVASPLGELPECRQHLCEPCLRFDTRQTHGARRAAGQRRHVPPQHLGRSAVVANASVGLPQTIGCVYLQGRIPKPGRQL
jgi:hypothetical protein